MPPLPFKLNQDRRHHIPKQKHKVANSAEYDASLRQRGSLTVWFTDEAVAAWKAEPRTTRGGQPCYSPLAILTALTLPPIIFPGCPERWRRDEALKAEADPPQTTLEQRHQAAGDILAVRRHGFFSAGALFSVASHSPVETAQ